MEQFAITYFLVRSFDAHSVYSRKHQTVNWQQPKSTVPNALELWSVLSGTVLPKDECRDIWFSPGPVLAFHRTTDLEDVPLQISPDGHVIGCSIGQIVRTLTPEEVMVWQPEELEFLAPVPIPDLEVQNDIRRCAQTILSQARSRDPLRHEKNRAQFSCIMQLLTTCTLVSAGAAAKQSDVKKLQLCEAAKRYIREHLHDQIRAEDVARQLQVSYSSLSRIFTACEGITLIKYVNREKVRLAGRLISENGITLAQAAQALSISDPSYLSRMFRRYTGKTATECKTPVPGKPDT